METLNFKWSIYNVKLNEEDAIQLLSDNQFMADAILVCLDPKTCEQSDIPLDSEDVKKFLTKFYKRMGYSMEFVNPILDKLN